MKAIAQRRETAALESLVDRVLCHDVRDAAGRVAVEKGARLTATSAATLLATPWDEIHVLAIEAGDLHEEGAGRQLAAAAVGDGVEVKGYGGGQWTLAATRRGLLEIRRGPLGDANALEGVSVFTLFAGQPVESGETVAKCKVTPLVIPESTIRAVETTARAAGGLVAVRGFRPLTLGAVAQERLDARQRARFEGALQQKAEWFGSRLLPVRFAGGAPRVNRTGKRRLPNHSAFCWSAPSKRARCLASRRSWATAPSVNGRKPRTATSPPAARRSEEHTSELQSPFL